MELYTISVHHGGSKANRGHNRRDEYAIKNQDHIDRDGKVEIWKDMSEAQAYEVLFGEALAKYNEAQVRKERKIRSYLSQVKKNAKLHSSYECIVQVGTIDHHPPKKVCEKVLKEFYEEFEKNNPNMFVFGAYLHMDEGTPHLHLDYIPIAHGYKKGLQTQTSLSKALEEMNYKGCATMSGQTRWQNDLRKDFEKICNKYDLEITYPTIEGREEAKEHMETSQYKATKELEMTLQSVEDNKRDAITIQKKLEEKTGQLDSIVKKIDERQKTLDHIDGAIKEAKDFRKERKKHLWSKDEITISYDEYQSLYKTATSIESVFKAQEDLDKREQALNTKESQIKPQMDEIERGKASLEEKNKMFDVYVEREAKKQIRDVLDNTPNNYTERLEEFLKKYSIGDKNLLEIFNQQEIELRRKLSLGRKVNRGWDMDL